MYYVTIKDQIFIEDRNFKVFKVVFLFINDNIFRVKKLDTKCIIFGSYTNLNFKNIKNIMAHIFLCLKFKI